MRIGLLDFGIRAKNLDSMSIIEDLIEYATTADKLGYSRLWLSEHHNSDPLAAWLNPEVLLPIIAGVTDNLRIGAGGILLANHSAYRVAYTFKLLNNLFNNRIDLGVAKGYTTRPINSHESNGKLTNTFTKDQLESMFSQNISALLNYLNNEDALLNEQIIIPPFKGDIPEIWSLTGSYRNLETLAKQGLNISRSLFHFGSDTTCYKEQLEAYKNLFYSLHGRVPKISLAFSGACCKDGTKAKKTYQDYSFAFTPDNIVGCPSLFEDRLSEYEIQYGIDEFIFMNVALTPKDRLDSLELIADKIKFL